MQSARKNIDQQKQAYVSAPLCSQQLACAEVDMRTCAKRAWLSLCLPVIVHRACMLLLERRLVPSRAETGGGARCKGEA
eukprot:756238-Hanusia_phi.AAC.3